MNSRTFETTGRVLTAAVAALTALALGTGVASAQQGTVTGQVVDASNLEPVVGAQVFFPELDQGTLTNEEGRYRITGVPAGQQEIRVRLLGYRASTQRVTVESGQTATVDFQLSVSAVSLGEIVVTQTGEQEAREIGSNISTIEASSQMAKSQSSSVQDLIKGQSTGVTLRSSSGSVGTGTSFQIRGNTSINLDNTPIIYVDGVRIDNSNTSGGGAFGTFDTGGQATSRINDLNPEDIESIEILKGPSATTLYGSEAAAGVLRITTKSGGGEATYTFRGEAGANFDAHDWHATAYNPTTLHALAISGSSPATFGLTPRDTTYLVDLVEDGDGVRSPLVSSPFRTGFEQNYGGNARGSFDEGDVAYYVSGEWENRDGNLRPNVVEKWNGRTNINFTPSEKVDLSLSSGFTSNNTILPISDNGGGPLGATVGNQAWATPLSLGDPVADETVLTCPFEAEMARSLGVSIGNLPGVLAASGLPGDAACSRFGDVRPTEGRFAPWDGNLNPAELENTVTSDDVNRFTGSATLTFRPVDWLTNRFTAGIDLTSQEQEQVTRVRPELVPVSDAFNGTIDRQNANTTVLTLQTSSTAEFDLTEEITSTTTGGVQYYEDQTDGVEATGEIFPAGSPAVNNSVREFADDFFFEKRTIGLFAEQRFGWQNKLFVTGGIRADDASAFGGDLGMSVFPQANASYVLSEEEWFPDVFESFRIRGAYGQSGSQPDPNDALALFSAGPTPFRGNEISAVSPLQPENADLTPERDEEFEAGMELAVLEGRLSGEFTWYRQVTNDAVVSAPLPSTSGFPNAQISNIGEMYNTGIEAAIDATAFNRADLQWDWRAQVSTTYNEITELESPITTGFGLSATSARHTQGEEFGSFWGHDVEFDDAGEEQTVGPRILGAQTPNVTGSLSSTLTLFNHVTLYALGEFAAGHQQSNITEVFNCGVGSEYECASNFEVGPEGELTDRAKARRFGAIYGALESALGLSAGGPAAMQGPFIEDGDYIKLRTLSLRFDLPDEWTRFVAGNDMSLTVVGENLALFSGYTGADPEVNSFNQGEFGGAFSDFRAVPPARRYTAELSISF